MSNNRISRLCVIMFIIFIWIAYVRSPLTPCDPCAFPREAMHQCIPLYTRSPWASGGFTCAFPWHSLIYILSCVRAVYALLERSLAVPPAMSFFTRSAIMLYTASCASLSILGEFPPSCVPNVPAPSGFSRTLNTFLPARSLAPFAMRSP